MSGEALVPLYNALGPGGYMLFCIAFVCAAFASFAWFGQKEGSDAEG